VLENCPRPWPRPLSYVLGLGLGLENLSSFNIHLNLNYVAIGMHHYNRRTTIVRYDIIWYDVTVTAAVFLHCCSTTNSSRMNFKDVRLVACIDGGASSATASAYYCHTAAWPTWSVMCSAALQVQILFVSFLIMQWLFSTTCMWRCMSCHALVSINSPMRPYSRKRWLRFF